MREKQELKKCIEELDEKHFIDIEYQQLCSKSQILR